MAGPPSDVRYPRPERLGLVNRATDGERLLDEALERAHELMVESLGGMTPARRVWRGL